MGTIEFVVQRLTFDLIRLCLTDMSYSFSDTEHDDHGYPDNDNDGDDSDDSVEKNDDNGMEKNREDGVETNHSSQTFESKTPATLRVSSVAAPPGQTGHGGGASGVPNQTLAETERMLARSIEEIRRQKMQLDFEMQKLTEEQARLSRLDDDFKKDAKFYDAWRFIDDNHDMISNGQYLRVMVVMSLAPSMSQGLASNIGHLIGDYCETLYKFRPIFPLTFGMKRCLTCTEGGFERWIASVGHCLTTSACICSRSESDDRNNHRRKKILILTTKGEETTPTKAANRDQKTSEKAQRNTDDSHANATHATDADQGGRHPKLVNLCLACLAWAGLSRHNHLQCQIPECIDCLQNRVAGFVPIDVAFPANAFLGSVICPYHLYPAPSVPLLVRAYFGPMADAKDGRIGGDGKDGMQTLQVMRTPALDRKEGELRMAEKTDPSKRTANQKKRDRKLKNHLVRSPIPYEEYIRRLSIHHLGGAKRCEDGIIIGKCSHKNCQKMTRKMFTDERVTLCDSGTCWIPYFAQRPAYLSSSCSMCTTVHV